MATKPKGTKGYRSHVEAVWWFPQKVRDELAYIAGLDGQDDPRAVRLLANIEVQLKIQISERRDDEEGPGPAAEAQMLRAVEEAARALEQALFDLSQRAWTAIRFSVLVLGPQPSSLSSPYEAWSLYNNPADEWVPNTRELSVLSRAAGEARKQRESQPGGRRPERARSDAIGLLAEEFQWHADGSIDDHYGEAVLEFVALALRAAGFSAPNPDKLWRKIPGALRVPAHRQAATGKVGRTTRSGRPAPPKRQTRKTQPRKSRP